MKNGKEKKMNYLIGKIIITNHINIIGGVYFIVLNVNTILYIYLYIEP